LKVNVKLLRAKLNKNVVDKFAETSSFDSDIKTSIAKLKEE
jgi:hypothetical protein